MNDDPSSNLAAGLRPDINNESNGEGAKIRIRERIATQTKRKAEFIHDIMFNLDILIYAELCVLYYME